MPSPPNGYQLARVPTVDTKNQQEKLYSKYPTMKFIEVPEYAQDWLFPAHALCTKNVVSMLGGKFQNIRTGKNKVLKENKVKIKLFTKEFVILERDNINDLIKRWGHYFKGTNEELETWLNPFYSIIDMIKEELCDLGGTAIYCNDRLQAINIFERPLLKGNPANLLMSFCNTMEVKGISEFSWVDICDRLNKEGIDKLNVGGSETYGGNWFKRKFNPIESKSLCTIDVQKKY
ncbi:MAG: hypothetical protein GY804_11355 [Alphaproteobacteria bacterium]|nr:hypothetical protein [Alphaproteobacteria bacterium]